MSTVEIKHQFTGAVLFSAKIGEDIAALSWSDRLGHIIKAAIAVKANLREADLSGADLRRADLSWANLREADLSDANLRDANLSDANLSRANLREANLSGADLRGANLRGANLSGAPVIPALDTKILAAIAAGGRLHMGSWHTCKTTHCRAGWAITLAGDEGKSLENKFGPAAAGALIYGASYPSLPVPNFYASNTEAIKDMRARAAQDGVS